MGAPAYLKVIRKFTKIMGRLMEVNGITKSLAHYFFWTRGNGFFRKKQGILREKGGIYRKKD